MKKKPVKRSKNLNKNHLEKRGWLNEWTQRPLKKPMKGS